MHQKPRPDGLYCPNPDCPLFGQVETSQLERHAYYGRKRVPQYLCRGCGKTFSETKGTFFYRLRTEREKVLKALAIVAEQGGIRATARVTGFDKDTIQRWVDRAGQHAEEVSAYMIVECDLTEAQLDELWTFVKKKTGTSPRRRIRKKSASSTCGVASSAIPNCGWRRT